MCYPFVGLILQYLYFMLLSLLPPMIYDIDLLFGTVLFKIDPKFNKVRMIELIEIKILLPNMYLLCKAIEKHR